jgi:hypothetical protein
MSFFRHTGFLLVLSRVFGRRLKTGCSSWFFPLLSQTNSAKSSAASDGSGKDTKDLIKFLSRKAVLVQPKEIPDAVPNDPDDNHIVACAIEGHADLIVSGDRHLLTLVEYEGIPIVRPMDFLRMVGGPKE